MVNQNEEDVEMAVLKKRSLLLVLVLIILTTTLLSACGTTNSKVLKVGIDDTYPPMEYKDEAGNLTGFDIEMAKEIGKRMGKEVEFVSTAWSAVFTALNANKFDCIISSLSITEDRKKTIAYTRPYIANSQVIVVRSDNTSINSENDLEGKIVAVQLGTTSEEACKEFTKVTPFKEFKKYEAMTEALSELKIGRVDAVVCDLVIGKYFVAKDTTSYKTVMTTLPNEPIGIGFKKSNAKSAEEVDEILGKMMDDGSLKAISEKWFGDDMTSNIE